MAWIYVLDITGQCGTITVSNGQPTEVNVLILLQLAPVSPIVSLLCLVMLGQRYTTPMVTVVCPVTDLHHMTSFQSASSGDCTS